MYDKIKEMLKCYQDLVYLYDNESDYAKESSMNLFIELYLQDYFNDLWLNAYIQRLRMIDNNK